MTPEQLVQPGDPEKVIHLVPDELQGRVVSRIQSFGGTIKVLGLTVSTGRVVEFRVKEYLAGRSGDDNPAGPSVPLIDPMHFDAGGIAWPRQGKSRITCSVPPRPTRYSCRRAPTCWSNASPPKKSGGAHR